MGHEKDIEILKALYYGNHLSDNDKERAMKLLKMMRVELSRRVK